MRLSNIVSLLSLLLVASLSSSSIAKADDQSQTSRTDDQPQSVYVEKNGRLYDLRVEIDYDSTVEGQRQWARHLIAVCADPEIRARHIHGYTVDYHDYYREPGPRQFGAGIYENFGKAVSIPF